MYLSYRFIVSVAKGLPGLSSLSMDIIPFLKRLKHSHTCARLIFASSDDSICTVGVLLSLSSHFIAKCNARGLFSAVECR
jgi:hypothetical protein